VKLVELIWLGQQITAVGRQQLQANAPGIPLAELVVMADLIDHAPSTITAIAQRTGYAQSRVSAAVASMADRAWVQTQADPSDGRRTVVVIPEQTLAEAKAYQKAAESRLTSALLDGVPHDRQPLLMQALEELLAAFRKRTEQPPRHESDAVGLSGDRGAADRRPFP
jgi:MarR family 2-MHQ and catechol resistance regulon transcriptional repressor